MSILVGRETRLVVQGITGREGEFHARAMHEYGTDVVAGVTPGKGGQTALDGTVPVFDTVAEAVRETGREHLAASSSPPPARPTRSWRRPPPASPRSSASPRASRRSTWSRPSRWCGAPGAAPDRAELPRRDVAGPGQGRDHPGLRPPRGPGRRRQPLGHAHLRGRPGDDRRRARPVDVRRDRRRPDHRHDVPRRAPAVRGGRRDRRDRADRRDRRRRPRRRPRRGPPSTSRDVPKVAFIAGRTAPEGKRMGHAGAIISAAPGRRRRRSTRSRRPASASPARRPSCRRCSATPATAAEAQGRRDGDAHGARRG